MHFLRRGGSGAVSSLGSHSGVEICKACICQDMMPEFRLLRLQSAASASFLGTCVSFLNARTLPGYVGDCNQNRELFGIGPSLGHFVEHVSDIDSHL